MTLGFTNCPRQSWPTSPPLWAILGNSRPSILLPIPVLGPLDYYWSQINWYSHLWPTEWATFAKSVKNLGRTAACQWLLSHYLRAGILRFGLALRDRCWSNQGFWIRWLNSKAACPADGLLMFQRRLGTFVLRRCVMPVSTLMLIVTGYWWR